MKIKLPTRDFPNAYMKFRGCVLSHKGVDYLATFLQATRSDDGGWDSILTLLPPPPRPAMPWRKWLKRWWPANPFRRRVAFFVLVFHHPSKLGSLDEVIPGYAILPE